MNDLRRAVSFDDESRFGIAWDAIRRLRNFRPSWVRHRRSAHYAPRFLLFVLAWTFPKNARTEEPARPPVELVITDALGRKADESLVRSVQFTPSGSLIVLESRTDGARIWRLGSEDDVTTLGGNLIGVAAAAWIKPNEWVVCSTPMEISIFDLIHRRKAKVIPSTSIYGWPIASDSGGICAWEGSDAIEIRNVVDGSFSRTLPLGEDQASSLAIAPGGGCLLAAVNRSVIRRWSLPDGKEMPSYALEAVSDGSFFGTKLDGLNDLVPKLFIPRAGMATAIRFSADGKWFAAGNEAAIHLWNMEGPGEPKLLRGHRGRIACLEFSGDGKLLVSAGQDGTLRACQIGDPHELVQIAKLCGLARDVSVNRDGSFAAVSFRGGVTQLWNLRSKSLVATLTFLAGDEGWIATSPEGLFDCSEGAWRYAAWRFPGAESRLEPVEKYFRDFYWPGLISDLLSGSPARPRLDLARIRRSTPEVKIIPVGFQPPTAEFSLEGTKFHPEIGHFRIEARPPSENEAVVDLSVFQNGSMVRRFPGKLFLNDGAGAESVDLELSAVGNRVTAAAFNEDGVRSAEAVWERAQQGWGSVVPQRTLHVVAIGISKYRNEAYDLKFPAADVKLIEEYFSITAEKLWADRQKLMKWTSERAIATLESIRPEDLPAKIEFKPVVDESATRAGILAALKDAVSRAKPDDAVLVFYSGHGLSDGYHYYLVPTDGAVNARAGTIRDSDVRAAAGSLVSDDDLEEALLPLNVAHAALILDACQSEQVLAGADSRGPLNPGGIGRLAYEKGIYLLASSEASRPAYEPDELGHGVLTYALIEEGLKQHKADWRPIDGRIELREWLAYGARRVSELALEKRNWETGAGDQAPRSQNARLAPRQIPEATALDLWIGDREP